MGVAALWIMLFHSTIQVPIRIVEIFCRLGYLGVDIFMFISGFSMRHSYDRSVDCKDFYLKRIKRIIPAFIPFAVVWWIYNIFFEYGSFARFVDIVSVSDLFMLIVTFRWFVPCICLFYLITPFIDRVVNKNDDIYPTVILLIISILMAMPFAIIGSSVALMMLIRLPEYIVGYFCGGIKTGHSNLVFRFIVIIMMFALYWFLLYTFSDERLSDTGLYWWPAVLGVGSMTILVAKIRIADNLFGFLGKYSLELYLWHYFIMLRIEALFRKRSLPQDRYGLFVAIVSIVVTCLFCVMYSKILDICKSLMDEKNRKK